MQYELVEAGEVFKLPFHENASTGYRVYIMVSEGLNIVGENFELSGNQPGAGGIRMVSFRTDKPDVYFISSINIRPWEFETPECNIIKVEAVEKGTILDITLYLIETSIQGYMYQNIYYDIQGNKVYQMKGSPVPLKLIKHDNQTAYTFYLDDDGLTYKYESCLYLAKNSKKTTCFDTMPNKLNIGTIVIKQSSLSQNEIKVVKQTKVSELNLKLYLSQEEITGYEYEGTITRWKANDKSSKIIDVSIPKTSNQIRLSFYLWNGKLVYLLDPGCCDRLICLYDLKGNELGCPSGGLTGKGSGMKFTGAKFLRAISLNT